LARNHVSDVRALFVADPFMIRVRGLWHMFMEVMNAEAHRGEIGVAVSEDATAWRYQGIVLREPFHLSYPYVFEWMGEHYLIPESYQAKGVRLYRARRFPGDWSFVQTLVEGEYLVEGSVVHVKRPLVDVRAEQPVAPTRHTTPLWRSLPDRPLGRAPGEPYHCRRFQRSTAGRPDRHAS
jgi:hypothetical protein